MVNVNNYNVVAPHWGAWIEMIDSDLIDFDATRRTPPGCVD